MLLRKENDSLKNDIRRKDLLIKSFENMEESRKDDRSFQLPKRSVARPLPKDPWNYLSSTSNRFMPLATTMDETYAKIVQSNSIGNSNREAQQTSVNGNIHQQCLEKKQVPERFPTVSNKSVTATSQASVNRNANTKQDSTYTARKPMGLPFGRKPPARDCTEVIGDSMVKHIMGHKMSEATGGSEKIFVHAFHGATTDHMNSHCIPTMKKNPKRIVLHCGTNDVSNGDAPEQIAEEIVDLAKAMKNNENTVFVSSIVPRGDRWNAKVSITNRRMKELCAREELPFIDNNNIDKTHHLNRSNLHLNAEGTRLLANNFLRALGHY